MYAFAPAAIQNPAIIVHFLPLCLRGLITNFAPRPERQNIQIQGKPRRLPLPRPHKISTANRRQALTAWAQLRNKILVSKQPPTLKKYCTSKKHKTG
jgi:hypothetical protein